MTRQAAPDIDFTRVTLFAIVGGRADTPVGKPLVESVTTADGENVVVWRTERAEGACSQTGCYATARSASTCGNHPSRWFQLTKMRLTIFDSNSQGIRAVGSVPSSPRCPDSHQLIPF